MLVGSHEFNSQVLVKQLSLSSVDFRNSLNCV